MCTNDASIAYAIRPNLKTDKPTNWCVAGLCVETELHAAAERFCKIIVLHENGNSMYHLAIRTTQF